MADLSYSADEASKVLSQSNDTANTSEEQMKSIMQKVSNYFGNSGSAMGGQLGEAMSTSFDGDIRPIFEQLDSELTSLIDSVKTTNTSMDNLASETTQIYQ